MIQYVPVYVVGALVASVVALENDRDQIMGRAVAQLFSGDLGPVEVIKWRDLHRVLEAAIDRCEDVANVIEMIVVKQGRAWSYTQGSIRGACHDANRLARVFSIAPTRFAPGSGMSIQMTMVQFKQPA